MSWAVSLIGKPQAVADELEKYGATLADISRAEFDAALPHLRALVLENFAKTPPYVEPVIHLDASGSGSANAATGEAVHRHLTVALKTLWSKLV